MITALQYEEALRRINEFIRANSYTPGEVRRLSEMGYSDRLKGEVFDVGDGPGKGCIMADVTIYLSDWRIVLSPRL